jgi:hypothetical protein
MGSAAYACVHSCKMQCDDLEVMRKKRPNGDVEDYPADRRSLGERERLSCGRIVREPRED